MRWCSFFSTNHQPPAVSSKTKKWSRLQFMVGGSSLYFFLSLLHSRTAATSWWESWLVHLVCPVSSTQSTWEAATSACTIDTAALVQYSRTWLAFWCMHGVQSIDCFNQPQREMQTSIASYMEPLNHTNCEIVGWRLELQDAFCTHNQKVKLLSYSHSANLVCILYHQSFYFIPNELVIHKTNQYFVF